MVNKWKQMCSRWCSYQSKLDFHWDLKTNYMEVKHIKQAYGGKTENKWYNVHQCWKHSPLAHLNYFHHGNAHYEVYFSLTRVKLFYRAVRQVGRAAAKITWRHEGENNTTRSWSSRCIHFNRKQRDNVTNLDCLKDHIFLVFFIIVSDSDMPIFLQN